jgi:hypothetical protein
MSTKIKTVAQIVEEYKNRQGVSEYEEIGIETTDGHSYSYNDITNLVDLQTKLNWLEFDSKYKNFKRHVKIQGEITRYINKIVE